MTSIPDHYSALGIDPTADQEVITAAYRALAKKYHPDTGATAGTASPERFEQIQQAYEVLRTPESRHQYDLELLAATERELAQHLANKRRIVPYAAETQAAAPPPPDLGEIRPEPSPRPPRPRPKQPVAPFVVPAVLLLALVAGGTWLFLPRAPEAPPLPQSSKSDVAVATPKAEPKPAAAATPAPVPQQPPLFGSSVTDGEPTAPVKEASAAPAAAPVDEPPATKPIFGTSLDDEPTAAAADDVPEADAPLPPVPKARPASAARQTQQQAAPRPQASAPRPQPVQPEPQPRRIAQEGPYRLVIFQRPPGGETTAWSAGVVFDTQGSCTQFGVKAVLRRLANRPPGQDPGEVWYECQPR